MINRKQVEQIMNALTLKCWGIISMDDAYRDVLKKRAYFNCANSILNATEFEPVTIVAIGLPYDYIGMEKPSNALLGKIDAFAWEFDYHTEVKSLLIKIKEALSLLTPISEDRVLYCVDNSPFNDREVAFYAGLGLVGYNHLLINDILGTHQFIGYMVIYQALPFESDVVVKLDEIPLSLEHPSCKTCARCVAACPSEVCCDSHAPLADMQRCLSSLTQTKGIVDETWFPKFGNRLYGCNVCQLVCPLNHSNSELSYIKLKSPNWLDPFEILNMTQRAFKEKFGHMGFAWRSLWIYKRNALIAIGNSGKREALNRLEGSPELGEDDKLAPYYRWALKQIESKLDK